MKYVWLLPCLLAITLTHAENVDATYSRIVTLSPHAAELVEFAGASERLIGVSAYTVFPVGAANLPVLADAHGINRELITALQPDLVIVWRDAIQPQHLEWLQRQDWALFISDPQDIADLRAEILQLGVLLETENSAAQAVAQMDVRLAELQALGSQRNTALAVLYLLWRQPLIVLTEESIIAETLAQCGIRTGISGGGKATIVLSAEALLALAPDVLLIDSNWTSAGEQLHGFPLLGIETDALHRPSPRMLDAALALCLQLQEHN